MNQDISPKQPNQKDDRQKQVKKEWKTVGPTPEKSDPSYEAERKTNSPAAGGKAANRANPSGSNGIRKGEETSLNTSEIQEGGKGKRSA